MTMVAFLSETPVVASIFAHLALPSRRHAEDPSFTDTPVAWEELADESFDIHPRDDAHPTDWGIDPPEIPP